MRDGGDEDHESDRRGRRPGRRTATKGVAVSLAGALLCGTLLGLAVVRGGHLTGLSGAQRPPDVVVPETVPTGLPLRSSGVEVYLPLPTPSAEQEHQERWAALRASLVAVDCDGLADAAPAVPPAPGSARLRSVADPVLRDDRRDELGPPLEGTVAVALVCTGSGTWDDGSERVVTVELVVDDAAQAAVRYR